MFKKVAAQKFFVDGASRRSYNASHAERLTTRKEATLNAFSPRALLGTLREKSR
jgi:hypothetical protein